MSRATQQRQIAMLHLRKVGSEWESRQTKNPVADRVLSGFRKRRTALKAAQRWGSAHGAAKGTESMLKELHHRNVATGYRAKCMGHDLSVGQASTFISYGLENRNGMPSRRMMVAKLRRMERRMWWKDIVKDFTFSVQQFVLTYSPMRSYRDQLRFKAQRKEVWASPRLAKMAQRAGL